MNSNYVMRQVGREGGPEGQDDNQENNGFLSTLRSRVAATLGTAGATLALAGPPTPAHADHEDVGVATVATSSRCDADTQEAKVAISIKNHSEVSWLDANLDVPGRDETWTKRIEPASPNTWQLSGGSGSTSMPAGEVGYTLIWEGHDNGQDHVATGTLKYSAIPCPSERIPGESFTFTGNNTPTPEPTPTETCSENFGPAPFSDRPRIPHPHGESVDCTYGLGIVTGFSDGTYGPERRVRRDQMASFIARALRTAGVELPEASGQAFGDVPPDSVHAHNIAVLAEAGITHGTTAHTFSPNLLVRRDQMASFLIRGAEYGRQTQMSSQTQAFSDVPPSNLHFPRVNGAAHTGLAQGYPDGTYHPSDSVRRDQMATFINRFYNSLENAVASQ